VPLSGHADGHAQFRGVSQHKLQNGQVGRREVVVRAIGWELGTRVPLQLPHCGAEASIVIFESSLTAMLMVAQNAATAYKIIAFALCRYSPRCAANRKA